MFLALLEERIAERAAQNADLARQLAGSGTWCPLAEGLLIEIIGARAPCIDDEGRPVPDGVASAKVLMPPGRVSRPGPAGRPSAYDELMQLRASRQPGAEPVPGLLPGPFRWSALALLAACATVTAVLGAHYADRGPGRLDGELDPRIQAVLGRFPALLRWLPDLGTLLPVTVMTIVLVLACLATRRWQGAALAALAVPAATVLTEYVLKPVIGRTLGPSPSFPSGHATAMFALAGVCAVLLLLPPRRRVPGALRLLLALLAMLLAAAVAAAMVAIGAHYFTDAVAGAAVGTGTVLACALILDQVTAWRGGSSAADPDPGSSSRLDVIEG
jgi:membrane-associated phospholipid phosphatase